MYSIKIASSVIPYISDTQNVIDTLDVSGLVAVDILGLETVVVCEAAKKDGVQDLQDITHFRNELKFTTKPVPFNSDVLTNLEAWIIQKYKTVKFDGTNTHSTSIVAFNASKCLDVVLYSHSKKYDYEHGTAEYEITLRTRKTELL